MGIQPPGADVVGVWVAAILTLMILSYLLWDGPLFRVTQHVLVGVTAGYAVVVAYRSVLGPKLARPLLTDPLANWPLFIPALLSLFLLARFFPRLGRLTWIPLAYLVGVGAALSLGGILVGTIWPQTAATFVSLDLGLGLGQWISNLVLVAGVICTLLYFYFTARPESLGGKALSPWAKAGRLLVMVALGAAFGGMVTGRVSLLIDRVYFLLRDWLGVIR